MYVKRAIELGAHSIWFSDHSPFPGDPFGNRMNMPDQFTQDWLRTSAGELRVEEETYTITTRNSSYVFVRDEEALSGENKLLPFLNTGIVPQPISEDEGPENKTQI